MPDNDHDHDDGHGGHTHGDHVGHAADTGLAGNEINLRRDRRLRIAIALNIAIVITQVVFGFIANSLGLLADAGHNLTDVAALALSLYAVRLVRRRATKTRSFGYHRASILAAQANAASILVVTAIITYEAIRRLLNPQPVDGAIVIIVALIGAAANLAAALAVRESHSGHQHSPSQSDGDMNIRSAVLHLVGDGAASIGVAAAGIVIVATGSWYWLDPAVSLGIGALIAYHGWKLLREANEVLLESTPAGFDIDQLATAIQQTDGIDDVHDIHVWSLSTDIRALSAHLVMTGHPTLEEAQAVGARVKTTIANQFGIAHATLELECEACDDGPVCAIDEPTAAP